MRFIPSSVAKEDMIVAKTIYNSDGRVLLSKDSILKKTYIDRLIELGISGIYIKDEISKDIVIKDIINDRLKLKIIKKVKELFLNSKNEKCSKKDMNLELEKIQCLIEEIVDEIILNKNLMVNILDLKIFDDYTFFHCVNVSVLSVVIGVAMELKKEDLYALCLGALLHDIGKVFIDKEILYKSSKLSSEEFEIIKKHPEYGYKYLREKSNVPVRTYVTARQHHERYDGSGYPDKKKENDICLFARIVSIVDVYDALTSDRPYRKALLPSEVMEYIMGSSGTMFDPKLVELFIRKIAPYPIGITVKLSNGFTGIVIENYEDCSMRPSIRIIKENEKIVQPYDIDLKSGAQYTNVVISEVVKE